VLEVLSITVTVKRLVP